jgi:isopenicillin N synthase-like dioxygenase
MYKINKKQKFYKENLLKPLNPLKPLNIEFDTLNLTTFDINKMISTHGFFYYPVSNMDLINRMLSTIKEYFELPLEVKARQPHNKEGLGYIPMNRVRRGLKVSKESYTYIPNKIESLYESTYSEYYDHTIEVAKKIFIEIMNSLDINLDKYNHIIKTSSATLSLLHYPNITMDDKTIGIPPHSDWGLITVLYTDNDGLQVSIDNKWYNIPHKEGYFIVNIADMVEILTNGRYKSTLHRVINREEKYSMALFYEPSIDTLIEPIEYKQYQSVRYGDYHGVKINSSCKNK